MQTKALLLIDIQNDYFPGGKMALPGSEAAGRQAVKLLADFREKGLPVVHVRHESRHSGAAFFEPDTDGAEIHASVASREGETIVLKHFPSSFHETGLETILRDMGITGLVAAGMMSNMCVDSTVRSAFYLGFQCIVAHDACAAAPLEFNGQAVPADIVHTAFMASLGMVHARVLSTGEILRSEIS